MGALEKLSEQHAGEVEFFIVYIKEAHPEEGWVMKTNRRAGIVVNDPRSAEERAEVAQTCMVRMNTSIPAVVDGIDNDTARQYGGWPDRLYLIGRDGHIAYQGEQGPFGFKPELLEKAIEALPHRPPAGR